METATKKITRAAFKSFIRKNHGELFIENHTDFDPMQDCATECKPNMRNVEYTHEQESYTMGIRGVWLVGRSRDWFCKYEDEMFTGITVSNCCGRFTVAIVR